MNFYKNLAGVLIVGMTIVMITASAQASQTANIAPQNARVAIKLMVEDINGQDNWFLCIVKTELLEGSERSLDKVPWVRCEIDFKSFRYRFAITKDPDIPSAFFFYAIQVPILPGHPPTNVHLSGTFTASLPQHDGSHYWRLSGRNPFFIMYITPFADEKVLQRWLSLPEGLKGLEDVNIKLDPIVGPHPKD